MNWSVQDLWRWSETRLPIERDLKRYNNVSWNLQTSAPIWGPFSSDQRHFKRREQNPIHFTMIQVKPKSRFMVYIELLFEMVSFSHSFFVAPLDIRKLSERSFSSIHANCGYLPPKSNCATLSPMAPPFATFKKNQEGCYEDTTLTMVNSERHWLRAANEWVTYNSKCV